MTTIEQKIVNDYQYKNYSIKKISMKYHLGQGEIRTILKNNGIYVRSLIEDKIVKNNSNYRLEEIEKIVIDNYLNKKYGLLKSGKQFDLSTTVVKKILKKYKISIRDYNTSKE